MPDRAGSLLRGTAFGGEVELHLVAFLAGHLDVDLVLGAVEGRVTGRRRADVFVEFVRAGDLRKRRQAFFRGDLIELLLGLFGDFVGVDAAASRERGFAAAEGDDAEDEGGEDEGDLGHGADPTLGLPDSPSAESGESKLSQPKGSSVDAGGTELYCERSGSGEPLLLIQGMSATHLAWGRPFLEGLEPSFECIAFDNRGMGRSGRAELPFQIVDMAEDAVALLDALGIETAHVAGISMGGTIAQEIALRHPERIRTLTLGATFCGGPEGSLMDPADLQMLGAAYASGDPEQVFRAMWEINISPGYRADDSHFDAFREMGSALPAPRAVVMQQMRACAEHDTSSRLSRIELPTLVVHGTADRLIKVENGELIARLIPAPIELLEGVGHMFWWEQPERSAELLREHALTAV
jgi:3-oxoadipate enol-lactonase